MRPVLRKLARVALGATAVVVVPGLVIHLPPVMRWLGAHGHHGAGICPLGYGTAAHRVAAVPKDGKPRPALGFSLGTTTAAQIEAWGLLHGVRCSERHHGTEVECANVPSTALGDVATPAATVWFSLDTTSTLRSVQVARRGPEVGKIASAFQALSGELATSRGAATKQSGSVEPTVLAKGALRQAMVEYGAADYRATLRATNMGDGFVLTEQYALVD